MMPGKFCLCSTLFLDEEFSEAAAYWPTCKEWIKMKAQAMATVPSFTSACLAWQLQESITTATATATAETMMMVASTTVTACNSGCPQQASLQHHHCQCCLVATRGQRGRVWSLEGKPGNPGTGHTAHTRPHYRGQWHCRGIWWISAGRLAPWSWSLMACSWGAPTSLTWLTIWCASTAPNCSNECCLAHHQLCLPTGRQQAMLAPHLHHANGQHGASGDKDTENAETGNEVEAEEGERVYETLSCKPGPSPFQDWLSNT